MTFGDFAVQDCQPLESRLPLATSCGGCQTEGRTQFQRQCAHFMRETGSLLEMSESFSIVTIGG